jgi:hypothetical protein
MKTGAVIHLHATANLTYERNLRVLRPDGTVPESSVAHYVQLAKDAGRIPDEAAALAAVDFGPIRAADAR